MCNIKTESIPLSSSSLPELTFSIFLCCDSSVVFKITSEYCYLLIHWFILSSINFILFQVKFFLLCLIFSSSHFIAFLINFFHYYNYLNCLSWANGLIRLFSLFWHFVFDLDLARLFLFVCLYRCLCISA